MPPVPHPSIFQQDIQYTPQKNVKNIFPEHRCGMQIGWLQLPYQSSIQVNSQYKLSPPPPPSMNPQGKKCRRLSPVQTNTSLRYSLYTLQGLDRLLSSMLFPQYTKCNSRMLQGHRNLLCTIYKSLLRPCRFLSRKFPQHRSGTLLLAQSVRKQYCICQQGSKCTLSLRRQRQSLGCKLSRRKRNSQLI
jgi:hypothetical protein